MSLIRTVLAASVGVVLVVGSVAPSAAVELTDPTTSYFVETAPNASTEAVADLVESTGGDVTETMTEVVDGVSADLSESEAAELLASPDVAAVYEHQPIALTETQTDAPWGLSRLDQAGLPVDSTYTYPTSAGSGIPVYVVDTGVSPNASQYQSRLLPGQNFASDRAVGSPSPDTSDCQGHGSHVAGIVGSTTYGVAKNATIVPVRVFECDGYGDTAALFGALDWIATQPVGVVNLSLSVTSGNFSPLDDAVAALVSAGYVVVVAAGNNTGLNACSYSPGSSPSALTVGATTSTDQRASYSNIGPCIDLFAPGSSIPSLSHTSTTGSVLKSGTSMATPHVAGVAALFWSLQQGAAAATIQGQVVDTALVGPVVSTGTGSPNRLLSLGPQAQSPSVPSSPGTPEPVYRFWSDTYQSHFYTRSVQERDSVYLNYPRSVWRYEGPVFGAYGTQVAGTIPVFRFWSDAYSAHFYTASTDERDSVIANYPARVWKYEGIAYFAFPLNTEQAGTEVIARFWSPTYLNHFLTASPEEATFVRSNYPARIWTYEGTPFRVPTSFSTPPGLP